MMQPVHILQDIGILYKTLPHFEYCMICIERNAQKWEREEDLGEKGGAPRQILSQPSGQML